MQRGAVAAPGHLAAGHRPSAGGQGNKYHTHTDNFSRSAEGREKRKRAVQKRACSFVCSRNPSCFELQVRWGWLLGEGSQITAGLLLVCIHLSHWKACGRELLRKLSAGGQCLLERKTQGEQWGGSEGPAAQATLS